MKTQLKIPRPCLVQLNRLLKIFLTPIQSKAFSGPVKSIPKDFPEADPVEDSKTFSGPVKSIPKDFPEADPVEYSKTLPGPIKSTPKDFSDADPVKGLLWSSWIDS